MSIFTDKSRSLRHLICDWHYEDLARQAEGARIVSGSDEVGAGSLWGPVYAASVCFPDPASSPGLRAALAGIKDSKQLSHKKRVFFDKIIRRHAISISVAQIGPDIIDNINIFNASILAIEESVHGLSVVPDFLLVDSKHLDLPVKQYAIDHGDALSVSIAAASIVAKVARDTFIMDNFPETSGPAYGLARHKGYGTAQHLLALRQYGPSPLHRMSFRPVREAAKKAHT